MGSKIVILDLVLMAIADSLDLQACISIIIRMLKLKSNFNIFLGPQGLQGFPGLPGPVGIQGTKGSLIFRNFSNSTT